MCLYGFAFELSHSLFVRVSVCACLYGLAFAILYGIFRRTSVCVCLYGFTFEISHRTLRRGGACSSRCTKPLRQYNPPKTALSLALHYHTWLPCQRELDCGKAFFILYIAILCDFSNVNICLALFAARLRDRLHRTFPLLLTPPLTIPL